MKALVIYDSVFGNTETIARAIGTGLGGAEVVQVGSVAVDGLHGLDLLIVGSPTRGWRPTPAVEAFLAAIPADGLGGVRISAFDTRLSLEDVSAFTRFIVKIGRYAAPPIAAALMKKGGVLCQPAEGFLVITDKGPLKEGEEARAASWAANCLHH